MGHNFLRYSPPDKTKVAILTLSILKPLLKRREHRLLQLLRNAKAGFNFVT